ncbi:hypothetical protein [Longimicrobium terrae]|uniref:Uncharacterized protein n=1 Tax=Longimicrobium terrae TaxID=1639882 RepID=A0A841GZI0_9BACT|nr:hypothetical protein [Longimicrobium terrae]MBB4636866.1 hypothetical protein [Longimicrobium terrae]MBB6071134.1 hypothetical protein [Longimicrobium terrae]NNC29183.1 hypothetical protein [Longimicrobium terrae]
MRDLAGRRIDPALLDSVVVTSGEKRERVPFELYGPRPARGDTARYFHRGNSGCRLMLNRVTLYRGPRTMHLDFGMVLDSSRRRGPSAFLIQAPPMQSGTFRLRWDPMEPGGAFEDPQRLPAERWERVPPG